jgi:carboxymethylenebutenolidase
MSSITIPSKDGGSFSAYIAMPAKTPAPALIVVQEIFGVNKEMRSKCDEFAKAGFIAICPDLFWRIEPDVQLTDKTDEEWQKAFGLMQKFDIEKGVSDMAAVYHVMRGHAQSTGKVGIVGYCLGGKVAYLAACRTKVDCAIGYYPVGVDALLDEAKNIRNPVILHIPEKDKFVPPDAQKKIRDGLKDNPKVKLYFYPEANHAFARYGGAHYDPASADTANARTYMFLEDHLLQAEAA